MSITGSEQLSPICVEDYLDGELQARRKHEYVDGQIYAMVGGRYSHNLIATNVVSELHRQLKNSACRALNSDSKVKVQISSKTSFYYPDLSVVCGDNIRDVCFRQTDHCGGSAVQGHSTDRRRRKTPGVSAARIAVGLHYDRTGLRCRHDLSACRW